MEVDEIVVITLATELERQKSVRSQLPEGTPWRFYTTNRDKEGGAAGCYRSHAEVLRSAQERNLRKILVLEDDFRLLVDWPQVIEAANVALKEVEAHDPNWSFLLLGTDAVNVENPENSSTNKIRKVRCASGTHAYIANLVHAGVPLPPYANQAVDQYLFCDYYCQGERPAGLSDKLFGSNALYVSWFVSDFKEPCETRGSHVYAVNPLLVHVFPVESTIDPVHTLYFKALNVLGPDQLINLATSNWGFYLHILPFLLFIFAAYLGAHFGRLRPASDMKLLVLGLLVLVATIAIDGGAFTKTSVLCTYTCYFLWRMRPVVLILLCCFFGGIMAYTITSRRRAVYTAVLNSVIFVGSLYLMALTVNTDILHAIANVVLVLITIAIAWLLFRPFYATAILFYCVIFFLFTMSHEFEDRRVGDTIGIKLPSIRSEISNENERCIAALTSLLNFLLLCFLIAIFALNSYTWR